MFVLQETLKACQEQIEAIVESHKKRRKEEQEFDMCEKLYDETDNAKCWIWFAGRLFLNYEESTT